MIQPELSSQVNGYCRLFAGRPDVFTPELSAALQALGTEMCGISPLVDPGYSMPGTAGYTYFGQVIDHDLTFDESALNTVTPDFHQLINGRTPILDLDTLYGQGPGNVLAGLLEADGLHFKLGAPGADGRRFDLAVNAADGMPLAADRRTLENLLVRQFVVALAKLHNAAVDQWRDQIPDDRELFEKARRQTVWQYQYLIVHDWLEKLMDPGVYASVCMRRERRIGWTTFQIPLEFSVAAMRFGHSMARANYPVGTRSHLRDVSLDAIMARSAQPGPLGDEWRIDYGVFFEGDSDTGAIVFLPIDTHIAGGLARLPHHPRPLPVTSLLRAARLGLADGFTVAAGLGCVPLSREELIPAEGRQGETLREHDLLDAPPLWYYLLRESAVRYYGNRLGPLGSILVAETIMAALEHDPYSYLNTPGWTPPLWTGRTRPIRRLSSLFRYIRSL